MARKRTAGVEQSGDVLIEELYEQVEKAGVIASRIGQDDAPSDLDDFVSSGSSVLDLVVSNRPNGGIAAFGRMIELQGLEQSGKSLVCAHMIANVQKEGGVAILVDAEFAINEDYFRAVGVDFSKVLTIHSICLEDVFEAIENLIMKIRQSEKTKKVLIIIDSLTALKPRSEIEGNMTKEGYGTQKAIFLSSVLPRINSLIANQKVALVYTQQLRQKMNAASFGDQYTTSGGKAPAFYASVRLRFSKVGEIKVKVYNENVTVGVKVEAKVLKNRFGPPLRKAGFDVYFDRGIDDVSSWIDELKKREIISGAGNPYRYTDKDTGEEFAFKKSTWKSFIEENPEVFAKIYTELAESMVMQYRTDEVSTVDGTASIDEVEDED
jgi:recombination protein RecA